MPRPQADQRHRRANEIIGGKGCGSYCAAITIKLCRRGRHPLRAESDERRARCPLAREKRRNWARRTLVADNRPCRSLVGRKRRYDLRPRRPMRFASQPAGSPGFVRENLRKRNCESSQGSPKGSRDLHVGPIAAALPNMANVRQTASRVRADPQIRFRKRCPSDGNDRTSAHSAVIKALGCIPVCETSNSRGRDRRTVQGVLVTEEVHHQRQIAATLCRCASARPEIAAIRRTASHH